MNTINEPLTLILPTETGLEIESMQSLELTFRPFFTQAEEWRQKALACKVTSEDDKQGMAFARESRLALKSIRVDVEKSRKRLKEDSLRKGKAIDGIANVFNAAAEPIETFLLDQEQFAARAAEARQEAIYQRRLTDVQDAEITVPPNLKDMAEDVYAAWFKDSKDLIQFRKDREAKEAAEAERRVIEEAQARIAKAEAERIERERISAENEKLRKEAAERERLAAIEREKAAQAAREAAAKAESERLKAEAAAKIEREKLEAIAKAEREKLEAIAKAEREKAAKLQAEIDAKNKAEKEQAHKEKMAVKAAAAAPEREKLKAFVAQIEAIAIPDCSIKQQIEASIERLTTGIKTHLHAIGG